MVKNRNMRFVNRVESIVKSFKNFFNEYPDDVFTSPGRIELIGNHTDHNHGLVMVGTVDLNIMALSKKSDDNYVIYHTVGFPNMKVELDDLEVKKEETSQSISMIRGVLARMKALGYKVGGIKVCTTTTIFKGAGVSSSAAFELLIAKMESYYYNNDSISPIILAQIAQYSESEYFGKPCGLLDQMGIALGGINYIDFNSTTKPLIRTLQPTLNKYDIVLVNTKGSHANLTNEYAQIKNDMFAISHYFNKEYLRDVDENEFYSRKNELIEKFSERVYLRAKHYFEENKRVQLALKAVINKDEDNFVKMLDESGKSSYLQLKNCYVKSEDEELPKAIRYSKEIITNGGVRVHGGGFAGTIIALPSKDETSKYVKSMKKIYGYKNVRKINLTRYGTRFVCKLSDVFTSEELEEITK